MEMRKTFLEVAVLVTFALGCGLVLWILVEITI